MKFRLEEKSRWNNTGSVITELGIGNFKAFGETQRVPIKPLTLIFGANSSGKSSIIHALLLAQHGLESGRLDAHQTALGGDCVDLGGFRQYVHRHEVNRRVSLYVEKPAPEGTSWDRPNDSAPWRAAFRAAKRVGLTFHIGLPASDIGLPAGAGGVAGTSWPELLKMEILINPPSKVVGGAFAPGPKLLRLEVLINGQRLMELERKEAGVFQVATVDLAHPFLEAIARDVMAHSIAGMLQPKFHRDFDGNELSTKEKHSVEKAHQEKIEADPFLSRLALARSDPEAARSELTLLRQRFATILKEGAYRLEGLALQDTAANPWSKWTGWEEEMQSDPVGFLRREDLLESVDTDWWAEAQALRYDLNRLLSGRFKQILASLRQLSYLGPLRCVPSRHAPSVRDQDPNWLAGGGAAWELAREDPRVAGVLNEWLGPARLGTNYRIIAKQMVEAEKLLDALKEQPGAYGGPLHRATEEALRNHPELAALTELSFQDTQSGTVVSHRDIGFGLSQVLPVLVTALASRERLIVVEQPELHLHPALQAELGDVFIESALGERKNTFLLETHSEHLILRILRRVRETTESRLPAGATPVQPENIAVVFVEPMAKGSLVRHLPVTPDGDFGAPWPGGFFADRLADLP